MGELASLLAAMSWAVGSLLFASAGKRASPSALNFAKCALGLVMLMATSIVVVGRAWPTTASSEQWTWLGLSGLLGLTIGDTAFFSALMRLGPRRALVLWALVPPLTAVLAFMALGEPLTVRMLGGIVVTTLGVTWVVLERASRSLVAPGHLAAGVAFGVLASLCQAVGSIMVKQADQDLSALDVSIIRLLAGTVGLLLQIGWQGRMPQIGRMMQERALGAQVFWATLIGTYLGIWLSIYGLQHTYAGIAATLQSTSPLFVLPLAVIFLHERLSARSILGAAVAVVGVALLLL